MFTLSKIKAHRRLQFHVVRCHTASNLNRDDLGRPKEMTLGGVNRLRHSSQSKKWRVRKGPTADSFREDSAKTYGCGPMIRTTKIEEIISTGLEKQRVAADKALEGAKAVSALLVKEKKKDAPKADGAAKNDAHDDDDDDTDSDNAPDQDKDEATTLKNTQLLALSQAEIDEIVHHLAKVKNKGDKDWAKNAMKALMEKNGREKRALRGDLSPEMQLFGRMVTSDAFSNVEPALQVAHAFTTHEAQTERDYWTGVDDFKFEQHKRGSGMIDVRRFGAGVFYEYACIDVDLLLQNLTSSHVSLNEKQIKELARDLIHAFSFAFAAENLVGHQNSFASHAMPEFIAIEVGGSFPHSAAAAYEVPVQADRAGGYVQGTRQRFLEWTTERQKKFPKCFGEMLTMGLRVNDYEFENLILTATKKSLA